MIYFVPNADQVVGEEEDGDAAAVVVVAGVAAAQKPTSLRSSRIE